MGLDDLLQNTRQHEPLRHIDGYRCKPTLALRYSSINASTEVGAME